MSHPKVLLPASSNGGFNACPEAWAHVEFFSQATAHKLSLLLCTLPFLWQLELLLSIDTSVLTYFCTAHYSSYCFGNPNEKIIVEGETGGPKRPRLTKIKAALLVEIDQHEQVKVLQCLLILLKKHSVLYMNSVPGEGCDCIYLESAVVVKL